MQFFSFKGIVILSLLLMFEKQALAINFHENLRVRQLNVDKGLSNEKVLAIFQSSDGYIWIGTEDGLNRYDGSEIVKFKNNDLDKTSISSNVIRKIYEDKSGRLWIATNNGLCLYVKEYQNFITYDFDPDKKNGFRNYVWTIYEDQKHVLWVGTLAGLFYLLPDQAGYKQFSFLDKNGKSYLSLGVFNIIEYDQNYWFGTSQGIYIYNNKLNQIKYYPQTTEHKNKNNSSNFASLFFIDKDNDFWIGTDWGLKKWDKINDRFEEYINQLVYPGTTAMCQDKNGNLWLGTKGGLNGVTQKKPFKTVFYKTQPLNPNSLSDNFINCLFTDRSGIIWVGTNQGINIIEEQYQAFQHVKEILLLDESLQANHILCFYEDGHYLYTGSRAGLDIFDKKLKKHIRYSSLKDHAFRTLKTFLPMNGNLLLSFQNGINIINTMTMKIKTITSLAYPSEHKTIILKNVLNIMQYDTNNILVAILDQGFYIMDKNLIIKKHFNHQTTVPATLGLNVISSIVKDNDGIIWIGTRGGGLVRFDMHKGILKSYLPDEKNPKSLTSKLINYLFVDKGNNLWIGTKTGGLCKYNRQNDSFITYKEKDGLSSNYVVGITDDDLGNLWISTGSGLSRLTKKTGVFRNFDVTDGLQGNIFNIGAIYRNKEGLIYCGGTNGYNVFDPNDIKTNNFPPIVGITNLSIHNKLVVPGSQSILKMHVSKVDSIALKYNENSLTFYFCALHFVRSDKNRFAYRLLGFENEWRYASSKQNFANYSNIPPGNYYFQVKAANSDGIWTPTTKTIFVNIKPPYWGTWWFRIFMFFIISGLIYMIHRIRVSNLEKQKKQLEKRQLVIEEQKEQIEDLAKTEHLQNELKLTFFANISHELRTPLSLILGPLDKLLSSTIDTQLKSQYILMYRNAQRLMRLLNQILDFRKLDLGQLKLETTETEIVKFTRLIVEDFHSLADIRETKLNFSATPDCIHVWLDRNKYEQIISNLLINAFKFTPEKGTISIDITTNKSTFNPSGSLVIKISDNGEGISKEDLDKIFSLFFQTNHKKGGFGIGLSLSYNLIKMHGGDIVVESEKNNGTRFTITLPLGQTNFSINEEPIRIPVPDYFLESEFVTTGYRQKHQLHKRITNHLLTILMIEDNFDLRNFIKQELEDSYNILEADNGKIGIQLAVSEIPDLIISDIMMPEMDGLELCTILKKNMVTSHIPIILLTARSAEEHQQEGYEHGADDYILKPFNVTLLKLKIKNQLKLIEQLREKYSKKVDVNISPFIQSTDSPNHVFLENITKAIENNLSDKNYSIVQLVSGSFIAKLKY